MKNLVSKLGIAVIALMTLVSCAELDTGFVGVAYRPYSGGLDPKHVYTEGTHFGLNWMWDDMIKYDARQRTTKFENQQVMDKDNTPLTVSVEVYQRVMKDSVGYLHLEKGKDYEDSYITPVAAATIKNVMGQYTYQEIANTKRGEVQNRIKDVLKSLYGKNFIYCDDVTISSIVLPKAISDAIVRKQTQDQLNLVAQKKEEEQRYLAKADSAKAHGELISARFRSEARDIMSQPKMIELMRVENEKIMWEGYKEHGHSPLGNNNMFGTVPEVIKGVFNNNNK